MDTTRYAWTFALGAALRVGVCASAAETGDDRAKPLGYVRTEVVRVSTPTYPLPVWERAKFLKTEPLRYQRATLPAPSFQTINPGIRFHTAYSATRFPTRVMPQEAWVGGTPHIRFHTTYETRHFSSTVRSAGFTKTSPNLRYRPVVMAATFSKDIIRNPTWSGAPPPQRFITPVFATQHFQTDYSSTRFTTTREPVRFKTPIQQERFTTQQSHIRFRTSHPTTRFKIVHLPSYRARTGVR